MDRLLKKCLTVQGDELKSAVGDALLYMTKNCGMIIATYRNRIWTQIRDNRCHLAGLPLELPPDGHGLKGLEWNPLYPPLRIPSFPRRSWEKR